MIFFALVLALAAEEWRERQGRLELADRALGAVMEEIRANRDELERTAPANQERLEAGQAILSQLESGDQPTGADIGLEVALLSSAAWQSAQMSQAIQYFELDVCGFSRRCTMCRPSSSECNWAWWIGSGT